ncbi:hypothetical protein BN77_p11643 [Rhizobium mesoamericanum STM3625]|uniref:Uncharacterized protein n=1 Tax=Rhizobium mesoamericanum STM3625 TaxID=1211777 RepID=K0Q2T2_9HYPH|nr:hypothetical protein BN77_p11643 [Rhizobium mesoamericanum STM3625]
MWRTSPKKELRTVREVRHPPDAVPKSREFLRLKPFDADHVVRSTGLNSSTFTWSAPMSPLCEGCMISRMKSYQ